MSVLSALLSWAVHAPWEALTTLCLLLAVGIAFAPGDGGSIAAALRRAGYRNYPRYLASAHWRRMRRRRTRGVGCFCCGRRGSLVLHHRTYARLGRERDSDLVPLCVACHRETHAVAKRTGRLDSAHLILRADRRRKRLGIGRAA